MQKSEKDNRHSPWPYTHIISVIRPDRNRPGHLMDARGFLSLIVSREESHDMLPALFPTLLAQLPRWDGCPYVVPNPKTRQPYDNLYRAWNRARTRAGLHDVRMHDLRHSFASFLVNAGQSLYTVAKILGHAQLRTTQRYSHLDQSVLLAASEAATVAVGWETAAPAVAARQPSPATV